MVTDEIAYAYAEINEIFNFLDENEVNKIPFELKEVFNKFQSKDYIPHIDYTKALYEQDLKKQTKDILVYLYVTYWCNDEKKKEVNKIFKENYEKRQLKLREKYNPDDIFKEKNIETTGIEKEHKKLELDKYNKSTFKKIINRIKRFFKHA